MIIFSGGPNLVVGNNASRTITLNEGDSFTANCAVASSVPPARIYFIVGTNTPMDITSNPVQTINDVKPNNAGTYVCRAESGQANTTYTYTLEIRSGKNYFSLVKITVLQQFNHQQQRQVLLQQLRPQ